jgi:hypothetical protein
MRFAASLSFVAVGGNQPPMTFPHFKYISVIVRQRCIWADL